VFQFIVQMAWITLKVSVQLLVQFALKQVHLTNAATVQILVKMLVNLATLVI
jgi:hypothetical protein